MSNSENTTAPALRPWLSRYAKLLVVLTLFLIFMGGQVKSHEAGLAVPDWPTSFGENMFTFHYNNWVGGIWHEHTHRLVASFIGLLTIIIMVWVHIADSRKWVKNLSKLALVAVIAQGLLGGLTVVLLLPAWVSVSHGVLAQTFLMITILLAYTLSREWREREEAPAALEGNPVLKPALIMSAVIYLQLILGAIIRHTESGLALPDFPLMAGQIVPFFTQESVDWVNNWRLDYTFETGINLEQVTLAQLWAHFIHRLGAVAVLAALFYVAKRAGAARDQYPNLWKTTIALMVLVTIQILLGILTVISHRVPLITSIHVVTGAATLGVSWWLTLRAAPLSLWQESEVQEYVAPEANTGSSMLN
ncbi:MAG TPA: heme A synthase [Candidatus Hydrogenedentes bacterium]|nr:heme A synthase [Candidatus Hydrogenedentota bacterium]